MYIFVKDDIMYSKIDCLTITLALIQILWLVGRYKDVLQASRILHCITIFLTIYCVCIRFKLFAINNTILYLADVHAPWNLGVGTRTKSKHVLSLIFIKYLRNTDAVIA